MGKCASFGLCSGAAVHRATGREVAAAVLVAWSGIEVTPCCTRSAVPTRMRVGRRQSYPLRCLRWLGHLAIYPGGSQRSQAAFNVAHGPGPKPAE